MDFYAERYGKVRQMSEKELKQHHDIIKKQNEEIENYIRIKTMNKQQFLNKLNKKINKFEKLNYEIVALVREFTFDKENIKTIDCAYELQNLEQFCFTYAWIIDKLNGNSSLVGGEGYNKSMSKKIRKALGYTV